MAILGFSNKQLIIVAVVLAVAMKWAQSETKAGKALPLLG